MTDTKPHPRRRARERALQYLFGLEFTQNPWQEGLDYFWLHNPARPSARHYAEQLVAGVMENQEDLDDRIQTALQHWRKERIGPIERTAIRIALYEMMYRSDVPATVAINEALEVVRVFAPEEATRFVNGVLDRLRRGLEETPGD